MIVTVIGFALFTFWRDITGFYLSAAVLGIGYGAMCPSFQAVFVNLAHNNRRGTANSTYLTSWDLGLGIGVLVGGAIAERLSYHDAYILAVAVCIIGTITFYSHIASHFNRNKLR